MKNRKILYGYLIQKGEFVIQPQEAIVAKRIATLYIDGLSYQKIADTLNGEGIPFSTEAPLWNKHKVKRLLETPRYTGADGYPAIIDADIFQHIQHEITRKTENYSRAEKRPALSLKDYLRCHCGGDLHRTAGPNRRKDTLYLKCRTCSQTFTILDTYLLTEVSKQMAAHDTPAEESYTPSGEVIRLTNAINRGREHPDKPEDVVSLILQGVAARYDCCPAPIESNASNRPAVVDFKSFGLAVSYITISEENTITVHFK